MKKIYIYLFLLFNISVHANEVQIDKPILHICTVASQETKGLMQLKDSCRRYNVSVDILGFGMPYRGNCEKLLHVQQYLETLPDNDVVLFVDGYDVLFQSTSENILNLFLEMNVPFVISVEKYCWPDSHLAPDYPKSPTSFKYINSGSYIGYVGHMKQIFSELEILRLYGSDQGVFTRHFFKAPEKYTFDYYCKLFLPLAGVIPGELIIDRQTKLVRCKSTKTTPCIIHGCGGGRGLYQQIYNTLYE